MTNYLSPPIEKYFEEIVRLESNLFITDTFLRNAKNKLQQENDEDRSVAGLITSYRDLSQLGSDANLYSPRYSYDLFVSRLDDEIIDITSSHCCLTISQAYEVFEAFLLNVIVEYLYQNQEKLVPCKLIAAPLYLDKDTVREKVKLNQRVNNKGLLKMVRTVSVHFRAHEARNIHGVNITQWFDLLSMVRHILVHNRQKVSHRFLDYLTKQKANDLFDRQFKRKAINGDVYIFLDKNAAGNIICWLNSFAFFVFKSLSLESGLSISVPQFNEQGT